MLVSSISYVVVKYFHPDSIDVKKLKAKGTVISEDKDTSILGKIDISKLIETDFTIVHPIDNLGMIEKISSLCFTINSGRCMISLAVTTV